MKFFAVIYLSLFTTLSLAQTPTLVKDFDNEPASSLPIMLTSTDNLLFLSAEDGIHGRVLWQTDGTPEGTRTSEREPSNADRFTPAIVINDILFRVNDEESGMELWKFSRDAGIMELVKDINPGPADGLDNTSFIEFTEMNGLLFFTANDGIHGRELWKSDGTEEGTVMVKDIHPTTNANPEHLTVMNGILYFTALDVEHGYELWRSDGTEEGTFLVEDINISGDSRPRDLTLFNQTLYFSADDGIHGRELWKSRRNETVMVKDLLPGPENADPQTLLHFREKLFFFSQDQLWQSDGTEEGTKLVIAVDERVNRNIGALPVIIEDRFFFIARDEEHGTELWISDGSKEGTVMVTDIRAGPDSSAPRHLTKSNNTLFFTANDGENGRGLWKSDGTKEGTVLLKDLTLSSGGAPLSPLLTAFQDKVFFRNFGKDTGFELWVSDGTPEGTNILNDLYPETIGGGIHSFEQFKGEFIFAKAGTEKLWAEKL